MGIVTGSSLTNVADITMAMCVMSIYFSMFFDNKSVFSWTSCLIPVLYQMIFNVGFKLSNPNSIYTGNDLWNSEMICFGILPLISTLYGILGKMFCSYFDSVYILPLKESYDEKPSQYQLRNVPGNPFTPEILEVLKTKKIIVKFGVAGIEVGWTHIIFTLIMFALILTTIIIHPFLIKKNGYATTAWLLSLLLPIVLYAIMTVYYRFYGDGYIFGLNQNFFKTVNPKIAEKFDMLSFDDKNKLDEQQSVNVYKKMIPLMTIHFLCVLVLGGTRMITNDADNNWLASIGLLMGLSSVLIIFHVTERIFLKKGMKGSSVLNKMVSILKGRKDTTSLTQGRPTRSGDTPYPNNSNINNNNNNNNIRNTRNVSGNGINNDYEDNEEIGDFSGPVLE